MTINTESTKRTYAGNGVATAFDYDFKIFVDTDLRVSLVDDVTGAEVVQMLNTDYTVTGEGFEAGGKVTFSAAPPDGKTVLILSDVPYTQQTDLKNQGRFFPETIENAFDRAARQALQLKEITDRSLTLPAQVSGVSTELPVPDRTKIIGWDSTGSQLQNYSPADLGTTLAFSNFTADTFTATAAQTDFTLSADPGVIGNLDVSIDGVTQVPVDDYSFSGTTLTLVTPCAGGERVLARYGTALPVSSADASTVFFSLADSGAVQRTVQGKLRDEDVTPQDFGAVADGVTDDTAALAAAINAAKSRRAAVFIPPNGPIRVTSGYIQSTAYKDVLIYGAGRSNEHQATAPFLGSVIILDSSDSASFFYRAAARHRLQVRDITFRCAQFVQDRSFFEFTSGGTSFLLQNVNFESVEKPIVPKEGCYFQNAAVRDVQFRNSGTIHSQVGGVGETNSLRGTQLVLDNVNHEGSVPVNTEKVVMNLTGIREIQARNVVLEGTGPGTDWTVLKLYNPYDSSWTLNNMASFDCFHSEWSGTAPATCVNQAGGSVKFSQMAGISPSSKYALSDKARAIIERSTFSGSAYNISDAITLGDNNCRITIRDCAIRSFLPNESGVVFDNVSYASSTAAQGQVRFSNTASEMIYQFTGGYISNATATLSSGTTITPSKDSTYGRKLIVTPGTSLDLRLNAASNGDWGASDAFVLKMRFKLPTFTGGTVVIACAVNNVGVLTQSYDSSYSGQVVTLVRTFFAGSAGTNVGMRLNVQSIAGLSGSAEIYCLELVRGGTVTAGYRGNFPDLITTYATAAPTAGEWARGDRVINSTPTVGQPKSWVCTVAGTPGTWVSEGNL